jgi:uncharacterized repeat protein (TIGR03803 family)
MPTQTRIKWTSRSWRVSERQNREPAGVFCWLSMIRLRTDERSLLNSLSDCEPLNERRLLMPPKRLISAPNAAALLGTILILATSVLAAPKYKVLHAFGKGHDGGGLWASLAFDTKGNLYGTTSGGGTSGDGTVFELTPESNGTWSEKILHSFPASRDDGGGPFGTPIPGRRR